MKKNIFFILLLFLTTTIFAEGLTGIFGINFGTNSEQVKSSMTEKGWNLSNTDGTTLVYKKSKGTYASLTVNEIKLCFYEDKLYDIIITFPYSTKIEDVISSVKAIQESCELTKVNEDSSKQGNVEILMYTFTDPKLNIFRLIVMGAKSITQPIFELTDFNINAEKKAAEDKIKEEETNKKNKSISSDL